MVFGFGVKFEFPGADFHRARPHFLLGGGDWPGGIPVGDLGGPGSVPHMQWFSSGINGPSAWRVDSNVNLNSPGAAAVGPTTGKRGDKRAAARRAKATGPWPSLSAPRRRPLVSSWRDKNVFKNHSENVAGAPSPKCRPQRSLALWLRRASGGAPPPSPLRGGREGPRRGFANFFRRASPPLQNRGDTPLHRPPEKSKTTGDSRSMWREPWGRYRGT